MQVTVIKTSTHYFIFPLNDIFSHLSLPEFLLTGAFTFLKNSHINYLPFESAQCALDIYNFVSRPRRPQ